MLTEDEARRIAAAAASQAVVETLIHLGIDTSSPVEVQKDMQALRTWRLSAQQVRSHGILVAVGIFVSGALALLMMGLKELFRP